MSKVYFTSDLHFGHTNLCRNLRHMEPDVCDNMIIENWNSLITKHDTVYVLGDLTLDNPKYMMECLSRLNGNIVVIGGNHDTRKCCEAITGAGIKLMGCLEYKGYICTHIPVHPSILARENFLGNIHGHIHLPGDIEYEGGMVRYEPIADFGGRYYNVNTEFHNYTPVAFKEIDCIMAERRKLLN